jgi:hypothetical protein
MAWRAWRVRAKHSELTEQLIASEHSELTDVRYTVRFEAGTMGFGIEACGDGVGGGGGGGGDGGGGDGGGGSGSAPGSSPTATGGSGFAVAYSSGRAELRGVAVGDAVVAVGGAELTAAMLIEEVLGLIIGMPRPLQITFERRSRHEAV